MDEEDFARYSAFIMAEERSGALKVNLIAGPQPDAKKQKRSR
jgi:hypothetical protein